MSTAPNLRDVRMKRHSFDALNNAVDHLRRSAAALRTLECEDSVAKLASNAALTSTEGHLKVLVAIRNKAVVS